MVNINSKGKEIVSVVQMGLNYVIGDSKHNEMPQLLPPLNEDPFFAFRGPHFNQDMVTRYVPITKGSDVIVGVYTAISMKKQFPLTHANKDTDLPPRKCKVVSSRSKEQILNEYGHIINDTRDFDVYKSIEEAIEDVRDEALRIVLGGGRGIYEAGRKYTDRELITIANQDYPGDVKYPEFPEGVFSFTESDPYANDPKLAGRMFHRDYIRIKK